MLSTRKCFKLAKRSGLSGRRHCAVCARCNSKRNNRQCKHRRSMNLDRSEHLCSVVRQPSLHRTATHIHSRTRRQAFTRCLSLSLTSPIAPIPPSAPSTKDSSTELDMNDPPTLEQSTAALKRPLLQEQSSNNATQAAVHEDRAAGASVTALCSARARCLWGLRDDREPEYVEGALG